MPRACLPVGGCRGAASLAGADAGCLACASGGDEPCSVKLRWRLRCSWGPERRVEERRWSGRELTMSPLTSMLCDSLPATRVHLLVLTAVARSCERPQRESRKTQRPSSLDEPPSLQRSLRSVALRSVACKGSYLRSCGKPSVACSGSTSH